MPDIACLGLLVADTVGRPIDALPPRGTLGLIERIELHVGGCAANTALSLAKIGVSTALLGKVGRDGFGDYLADALSRGGVDVSGVARDTDGVPTAATIVAVHSDAERTFLHVPGANATLTPADIHWESAEGASIFHVAGLQLMAALEGEAIASVLAEAKRRGLRTTLDTVMNPRSRGWEGLAPALPYLDWALPSFEEARALTGADTATGQARRLREAGAKNVAIKLGAEGCFVQPESGDSFTVAPFPVQAIDALGAGDAWVAGFLTGLLHHWPLLKTARFANAVGACAVQALGATTGIRPLENTLEMLLDESA